MKRKSVIDIVNMKSSQKKITALTCYDNAIARILGLTNLDTILVGDSLSMVFQGHKTTLPVTLDEVIYHTKCVGRAEFSALLVIDLPFLSYQSSTRDAILSAGRCLKETSAQAVKLEGARLESIKALVEIGIPVMGHLGLTPQSINAFGSYATRCKTSDEAEIVLENALKLEEAGCFSIVLEKIPASLAESISKSLRIPTIGIGAGAGCDGQILVINDMLNLNSGFKPRFVHRYANLEEVIKNAVNEYCMDVIEGRFPSKEHSY